MSSGFAEMLQLFAKPSAEEVLCRACGWSRPHEPLTVEWDDGSDKIGDFTSAGARVVATAKVADELLGEFGGARKGSVSMPSHPRLIRPAKRTRTKRVWLPYDGPPLCELIVTRETALLPQSTAAFTPRCHACGRVEYQSFDGIETQRGDKRTPRTPGMGLFFRGEDLRGDSLFRPPFSGLVLCTSRLKEFVKNRGYSNVEFLEAGELL